MQKYILILIILMIGLNIFANTEMSDIEYCSYAVTADGRILGYYGEKPRIELSNIKQISKHLVNALIATEDKDFFKHDGVSMKGLGRAITKTITGNLQGGSTITMQLARNLYLTQEKTLSRKFTEIKIARELESKYSKEEILLMYFNIVYFGNSAYGIWAASEEYFSKSPDQLNIEESALLVGILNSPSAYDPIKNPNKAISRRNLVLKNMYEDSYITQKEYEQALDKKINLTMREKTNGFFLEYVRLQANQILKSYGKNLSSDIFIIETTLDSRVQRAAGNAMRAYWKEYPKSMQDAELGLISLDVNNGSVRAMLGGNPKALHRGLNRSTQIKRQPGSSFKPMLYGYLLRSGFNLATPLKNMPIEADTSDAEAWIPRNNDNSFSPSVTMLNAIKKSINLAAAYSVMELASPDSVRAFAELCGIESNLKAYNSIVLGTSEVSPLEMARAFNVFASGGYLKKTWSIVSIKDKTGKVYYRDYAVSERVLDEETAYLMTYALKKVVDEGSGYSVRWFYNGNVAGKTGTTTNSVDAWFVGYNTQLTTAIWVGYDDPMHALDKKFGYGSTACAPILGIMYRQLRNNAYYGMNNEFAIPDLIEEAVFCKETGMIATEDCSQKELMPFNSLYMPEYCTRHIVFEIEAPDDEIQYEDGFIERIEFFDTIIKTEEDLEEINAGT
ncbi:MAG: PBP1A family penicillin-binding protein [Candidatus Cloacimonadales bacterium]|jgi:1A family penicillin-binding protein|nr:PBP1A family penicillin-binding protein [Candidatus Cloacimonadales bacterium]